MGHGMATPPLPTDQPTADHRRVAAPPPPPPPHPPATQSPAASTSAASELLAVPGPSQPRRRAAAPRRKRANRCATCGKCFSSPGKLAQHQYSHTGERPFVCQRCEKSFSSKFKLMRHVLTHSKERQFQCTECSKGFYRKDHLKNHMETHNPNKHMFTCPRPACGKEYTSSTGLKKHVALHEAEDGNLMCTLCGVTFQARDDIIFHLKTHVGSRTVKSAQDKKFQCDVCKKRFFTRKDVKRHHVVHTGTRDFVCELCPQKFGRKDHLVRHVKKSHSTAPGAPLRRGRVKSEPPPASATPGSPGGSSAPQPAAAAADASGGGGGGGVGGVGAAVFAASSESYYASAEERDDAMGASGGGSGIAGLRPLVSTYQPPPPEIDLPDPLVLSCFDPADELPDLGHPSADLSAMFRVESFAAAVSAADVFYQPHPRLTEHHPLSRASEPPPPPPELFPLSGPVRPPLAARARLPPGGKDLSALMHASMSSSMATLPAPTLAAPTLPTTAAAAAAAVAAAAAALSSSVELQQPGPPPDVSGELRAERHRSLSPEEQFSASPFAHRYYDAP